MTTATLTNGALVAEVRRRVEESLATSGRAPGGRKRPPGRRKLAAELAAEMPEHGITEYQVRRALEEIERAPSAPEPAAEREPAVETGSPDTAEPGDGGRPVGETGRDREPELDVVGAHSDPMGEIGRPAGGVHETGRPVGSPGNGGEHAGNAVEEPQVRRVPVFPTQGVRNGEHAGNAPTVTRRAPRWPLLLLALPAFVAVWGGWVGLGAMCGFGKINLLPGIGDGWEINSAITLPIGLEVYAAYALYVWLSGVGDGRARRFARVSALASLVLGAGGQIAYHVMEAAGVVTAPWAITAVVATLPVAVLGMGAALAHLIAHAGDDDQPVGDHEQ